jgi:hypothetical protein
MTSQIYQADDDQMAQAHDQAISEESLIEAEASLAAAETDLAEPDASLAGPEADLPTPQPYLVGPEAELATSEPHLADPDPVAPDTDIAEPDADQTPHEDPTSHQVDAVTQEDSVPATSMMSGYPGFISDGDDSAAEPEMGDSSSGSASLVSGAFTVPESSADAHPAADTARVAGPWNEVQAMFVDDPRASIERAAGLVDGRVEELIQSVRERQDSMQSAWQADDAGTEELRVALQHYRSFWNSLEDLPAPA